MPQMYGRSELKISGAHVCALIEAVGFGARVDWLSIDVAVPLVTILCGKNQQFPSTCQHDGRPFLNVLSSVLSVAVGDVFRRQQDPSRHRPFCQSLSAAPSGAPRGHIWQCVPRSKVQSPRCVCVCVCVCVCARVCVRECEREIERVRGRCKVKKVRQSVQRKKAPGNSIHSATSNLLQATQHYSSRVLKVISQQDLLSMVTHLLRRDEIELTRMRLSPSGTYELSVSSHSVVASKLSVRIQ